MTRQVRTFEDPYGHCRDSETLNKYSVRRKNYKEPERERESREGKERENDVSTYVGTPTHNWLKYSLRKTTRGVFHKLLRTCKLHIFNYLRPILTAKLH